MEVTQPVRGYPGSHPRCADPRALVLTHGTNWGWCAWQSPTEHPTLPRDLRAPVRGACADPTIGNQIFSLCTGGQCLESGYQLVYNLEWAEALGSLWEMRSWVRLMGGVLRITRSSSFKIWIRSPVPRILCGDPVVIENHRQPLAKIKGV